MGKHDRNRAASHEKEKDWNLRSAASPADDPQATSPGDGADPEADFEGDDEPGGVSPGFAREIKIGLAALGALLLVLVVVVWSRVRHKDETPPPPEKVAGAQPAETPSPATSASPPAAKAPRELTATEPKEPLLPSRQGTLSAAQARAFGEPAGAAPADPFGARGGPSFMPKAAKPASTAPAAPAVAAAARGASPFAADSLPPEPPGDEITVGEGPVDPFRNKAPALGASLKPSAAIAASVSADPARSSASVLASPPAAGLPGNSPNPLRGASPSVAPVAEPSGPWATASVGTASPGQPAPGMARAEARPAGPVQASAPLVAPAGSAPVPSAMSPAIARPAPSASRVYIVREGDTLYDIARNELGKASRWGEIYDLNWDQLGNRVDGLVPGMKLRLPEDAGQPAGMLSRNPQPPGTTPTVQR